MIVSAADKTYDECWFVPDPAEQFANPYLAMGNNPVVYVDPDGEFIFTASAIIIGAMIGSFTGAVASGYSGADPGQIMASFGIGALAGGLGGSVAASSGTVAGAITGGAVNGSGNEIVNGLFTNENIGEILDGAFTGGVKGALTGLIGGSIGGGIGGGAGAFFGGASAGAFGTAINGGSGDQVWKSALAGGISSYGLYHLNGIIAYKKYKDSGLKFQGGAIESKEHVLSYKQFMGVSRDFQRARFWKREQGGKLVGKGIDRSAVAGKKRQSIYWDNSNNPEDAWARYHIHHGKAGTQGPEGIWVAHHSSLDLDEYAAGRFNGSFVINRLNTNFRPPNVWDVSGLQNYSIGFLRSFIFPFFGTSR